MKLKSCYQDYLDQLTHEERSIFLYGVVLKVPSNKISKRLNIPVRQVKVILNALELEQSIIKIKLHIYENMGVGLF